MISTNPIAQIIFLFALSTALSTIVIRFAISVALTYGIADHPGGHKQHDTITPFVGGVGILIALSIALIMLFNTHPEEPLKWLGLGLGSIVIFATGFADDLWQLNYKVRLIIQAAVALVMVLAGGVVLTNLGSLLPGLTLELGLLAIPFTIFATIGGINALNMIDGMDGLAGSLSLVSLLLISAVAFIAGDSSNLTLAAALASGTTGFLYFNLRHASQRRARVFLGDNGSMLLGFLFAWLLVDLSQEPNQAMTPVTAIWLFSIPLMDTISVMLRRVVLRKSPFIPDHNHLHHILLHAGFRIEDTVIAIASLHLLFGITGLAGLYLGAPEFVMLLGFLLVYAGYFYVTQRPWYFIMALRHLHTILGLTPAEKHGLFLGSYTAQEAESLVRLVSKELGPSVDSWVQVLEKHSSHRDAGKRYAVAVNIRMVSNDCATDEEIKQYVALLQQRMMERRGIQVRQFFERNSRNDRRADNRGSPIGTELRISERRNPDTGLLILEVMFDKLTPEHHPAPGIEKSFSESQAQSRTQSTLQETHQADK
ncbi:undecaprenyl-phosphate alpha-N-acetylglucosaminyl 1-phosphatetransferase [Nitrosomonas sp. Nm58]|nr:undecaprenyl-phosphate alpha-N-acetylglucosaminyl 1-phosphatetransferase [Nitrosomonas sp. Nm58]